MSAAQLFSALIGTFHGEGKGYYPTIEPFTYTETVTFTDVGKPFLHYVQKTVGSTGTPLHTETGYLRAHPDGWVELILAQPTGHTEILHGTWDHTEEALTLTLSCKAVGNSPTAKLVEASQRSYRLTGDSLQTTFGMAAVGESMHQHLESTLTRLTTD